MGRVIVLLEPSFFEHQENDRFAARFPQLGLTSFGTTRDEALESLKRLFVTFVRVRRENGTLEEFLNAADVEWYPESEYPSNKGDVEYLAGPPAPSMDARGLYATLMKGNWKATDKHALPLAA